MFLKESKKKEPSCQSIKSRMDHNLTHNTYIFKQTSSSAYNPPDCSPVTKAISTWQISGSPAT